MKTNIEILKNEFTKNRTSFINLADELIRYIHDKVKLIVNDRLSPLGGRAWLLQNELKNPNRFVIIEIYANGELVFKFRNENTKEDDLFCGSDIHFFIMVENGHKLLKNAISKIKKHCNNTYESKLSESIDSFIVEVLNDNRIKNSLDSMFEHDLKKNTLKDLLNTDGLKLLSLRNFGLGSWKKLMFALYKFGIEDCFDYPIAKEDWGRASKNFITKCKKEITGS